MRENLLKKQPTWGLRRAQGTGQKSATPATLTKVILVLLTMFLLPSAAWGQGTVTVTKTITFNQEGDGNPVIGNDINNSAIPVSVSEKIGGTTYSYNSNVFILDDDAIEQYSSSSQGAVFKVKDDATSNMNAIQIIIPGNYPTVPTMVKLKFEYANAIPNTDVPDDNYNAIIQVCDYPLQDDDGELIYDDGELLDLRYTSQGSTLDKTGSPLIFTAGGKQVTVKDETFIGEGGTDRYGDPKSLWIMAYLDGNPKAEKEEERTTFTITEVEITYNINESDVYGLTVAGVPVTRVNKSAVFFDKDFMDWKENEGEDTGTVSFTPAEGSTPATLTLNGADIEYTKGNVIVSTLTTPLAVNLSGEEGNTIICGSNLPFEGPGDDANLVFKTSSESLVMESEASDFSPSKFYTGFEVSYEGNMYAYLSPDDDVVIKQATSYNLTVAGVEVTSANCDDILKDDSYNAGKVSFKPAIYSQTPTPATLTLKGVTIEGRITWSDPEEGELSIIIDGDNAITNSGGALISFEGGSQTPPQLSFSKAEGSGAKTLILQSDVFPISGFDSSSPTIGDGLKAVSGQTYMGITTKDVYDLWIDGTQVHDIPELPGYKGNILGGTTATVSFDGSQTLTLNNAEIYSFSPTHAIKTGLSTLNIDLKGNNSITTEGGYALYGNEGTRTIIFTSSSDPVGNLTLKNSSGELAEYATIQYDTNTGLVPTIITPSNASDLAAAKEAIIAKGTAMGITVAGVVVTNSNYTDIKGDGITGTKVSFTPANEATSTPATLTLDNASITGDIKFNASLTVHLIGDNTITKPGDASSFYAFNLGNDLYNLYLSTDETKPGTLKFVGLDPGYSTGSVSQRDCITYRGSYRGNSGTAGDVTWKETYNSVGETPSYLILSLNKHYNLWKTVSNVTQQFHDLNLGDDGFLFNPEESTLTINSSIQENYINSGLEDLTIIVSGSHSLSHIAFGAPAGTQAEGITTGTLTITGKKDSESSSSSNSLSLSNSGGVITGFSSVDITLPMHVSYTNLDEFTGWTTSVTRAYITDEPDDDELSDRFIDGINYVTYYSDRDLFLSNALTPSVITEISGSTVKTQALSYIPKKTPVLVTKATNTATTATFSKNLLKFAEDNPVTALEGKALYVLYNDQFVKVTPESEIYNAGYLDLTDVNLPSGTRSLTIDGDDEGTTALREVKSEGVKGEKWDDGEWYTLQGRKFTTKPTKPGLYILNGKKVVVK